jgi:hypothetical protein
LPLDPDPDSESGSRSRHPIELRSNPDQDPDPQPCLKVRDFTSMFFKWEKDIISYFAALSKTQEMDDYVFFRPKKHKIPIFENQRHITGL